jgi:hypothetical protein
MTVDSMTPEDLEYLQTRLVEKMEAAGRMPLDVAHGFLTATATGAAAQQPVLLDRVLGRRDSDERLRGLLAPIMSFLMYEQAQWFDPPNEVAHRETVGQLGDAAVGLFQWWQTRVDN